MDFIPLVKPSSTKPKTAFLDSIAKKPPGSLLNYDDISVRLQFTLLAGPDLIFYLYRTLFFRYRAKSLPRYSFPQFRHSGKESYTCDTKDRRLTIPKRVRDQLTITS